MGDPDTDAHAISCGNNGAIQANANGMCGNGSKGENRTNGTTPELRSPENMVLSQGTGLRFTIFNISNTIMGGGILGLPNAMEKLGLVPGCGLLVLAALLGCLTVWMLLIAMEESRQKSYAEVAGVLYGQKAQIWVDFTIILYNFGVLVSYVMIIGDIVPPFLSFLRAPELLQDRALVLALSCLVLYPLSALPNMGALRHASLVCVVTIFCLALYLFAIYATEPGDGPRGGPVKYWSDSGWDFTAQVPVLIFAYTCNMNVPIFYAELREKTYEEVDSKFRTKKDKMMFAMFFSSTLCFTAYVFVALFGYFSYKSVTAPDILTNLQAPDLVWASYITAAYSLVMFTSFPVMCFSCVQSIHRLHWELNSLLHPDEDEDYQALHTSPSSSPTVFATPYRWPAEEYLKGEGEFQRQDSRSSKCRPPSASRLTRQLLALMLVVTSVFLGWLLPDLSVVFGLTGGFCGGLITFCFPGLFYIRVAQKKRERMYVGPWIGHVVLWIGLLAGVGSSAVVAMQAFEREAHDLALSPKGLAVPLEA